MKIPSDALVTTIINLLTTFLTSSENKISKVTKCYQDHFSPFYLKLDLKTKCKIKKAPQKCPKMVNERLK